jgi:plastocyanin
MKTVTVVLAAVAALAIANPAGAATKGINIYGSGFSPKTATITEGDTVKWTNRDNVNHQVLASKGEFVSPILHPGQSFSFTFRAAGTYDYKDELHPKLTGTIKVNGLPPSLTLTASLPIVTAGDKVTLSGVISNKKAGEQVTIYYQPYPQPSLIQRATVLTTTGGVYSFLVAPGVLTTYQASWKGAFATPATVQVMPRLVLGRSNGWIVHVYAGRSMAGRTVQFQRYNGATGQWVTLKRVQLDRTSSARFSLALPKGLNKLRLTMSVNQAGAGYLGVVGPVINWRQR